MTALSKVVIMSDGRQEAMQNRTRSGLCKTLLNKFSSAWMHKSSKLAKSDEEKLTRALRVRKL